MSPHHSAHGLPWAGVALACTVGIVGMGFDPHAAPPLLASIPARMPEHVPEHVLVHLRPLSCEAGEKSLYDHGFTLDLPSCRAELQPRLTALRALGIHPVRILKLTRALAIEATPEQLAQLKRLPWVERLTPDAPLTLPPEPLQLVPSPSKGPLEANVEANERWNLAMVRAPDLWSLGIKGAGAVVASLDSGVDRAHVALSAGYRGAAGDWLDLFGEYAQPTDEDGHGTQSISLAVGREVNGQPVGVAPAAQWIAVRMFQNGASSLSLAHQALDWAIDPDGNPATSDQPDVVLASWWLEGSTNTCLTEFSADFASLEAAGIPVVFAGGNTGPNSSTSVAPATDPDAWSVGAVDASGTVASFSARGPSACGGSLYPQVSAPGVQVEAADLTFGVFSSATILATGTSFAAPAVAGAVALLRGQEPLATPSDLQIAILSTALDIGPAGDDMQTGTGLLDVFSALQGLAVTPNLPPEANADTGEVHRGKLSILTVLANDSDPEGQLDVKSVRLEALPRQGVAAVAADGTIQYTASRTARGQDTFSYTVADSLGQRSPVASVVIKILLK